MAVATIRDVARAANVSIATVSHVLNGTRTVAPATREQIELAILTLGYQRNALGRNLRRQRSQMVAVVVSDIANPFFSSLAKTVEDSARHRGYSTIVCNTNEDVGQEQEYFRVLAEQMVEGIILSPCTGDHGHLAEALRAGRRLVVINRAVPLAVPTLVMDNAHATEDLCTALLASGCTRLAVVAGPRGASTTQQRLDGFSTALDRAGVAVRPDCWRFTDGSALGGYRAARELLATCAPDGVLAFNTLLAEGVLTALHQVPLGRRPALAGFDVPHWASLAGLPCVCSARQPVHALAEKAAQVLLEWMEKGVMPESPDELPLAVGPVLPALDEGE